MQSDTLISSVPAALTLDQLRAEISAPWPMPHPLGRPAPPSLDLDAAIPAHLRRLRAFCEGLAEAYQVPPEAVFSLSLAIASGCAARSVEIRVGPDWIETVVLWVAVLMESAERKSAMVNALARPVFDWQRDEAEHLRRALAAYAENRRCLEAELASARGKYAKTRPGTPERTDAQTTVREIAETLDAMPELFPPSILTADNTPESLRELLARNGEKALWVAAEVDADQLTGTRYGKSGSANLNTQLAAKSGDPVPVQRVGRDQSLARPCLAVAIAAQPVAFAEVIADSYAQAKGFVPRFNFVTPAPRLGFRVLHPAPLDPTLSAWWAGTLRDLLAMPWPGRVVSNGGELTRHKGPPRELRLTPAAVDVLNPLRADIEHRIAPGGDLRPVQAYASKLPGEVVRIAAVLELIADPAAETVEAETMRAAVEWGGFLLAHHRHALGEATTKKATKDARRLLDALRRHAKHRFTLRDAQHLADLDRDETEAALAILDDEGWTREAAHPPKPAEVAAKGGRPPGPLREVNPALFAE